MEMVRGGATGSDRQVECSKLKVRKTLKTRLPNPDCDMQNEKARANENSQSHQGTR